MKMVLMAIVLFVCVPAFGLIQYSDGSVHNLSATINDDIWVDYLASEMRTTLNILSGCQQVGYGITGWGNSAINISGGLLGAPGGQANIISHDNVVVNVFATGQNDWGPVLLAYDKSNVSVYGGTMLAIDAENQARVSISGGSIGGTSPACLSVNGASRVVWSGGTIHYGVSDNWDRIEVTDQSILTIKGYNFSIDGNPVGFGDVTSLLGGFSGDEPYRRLTGMLANGDMINNQFRIGYTAEIALVSVPEPATLGLLSFGFLALLRRRRA